MGLKAYDTDGNKFSKDWRNDDDLGYRQAALYQISPNQRYGNFHLLKINFMP